MSWQQVSDLSLKVHRFTPFTDKHIGLRFIGRYNFVITNLFSWLDVWNHIC